jgi:hypothetical protein
LNKKTKGESVLTTKDQDSKPLHEVINYVVENCYLQVSNVDVGTPFICGAPGGGKTASLHHLSKQFGFNVLSTHLALKPLEETGGIPQFERITINGIDLLGTIWSFPDIMKKLYELSETTEKILVWLLDDAHLLSTIHMGLLYELLTERTLRSYKIPQNCAIVMAGNTSNKSGAKTMFSAIVNRCILMPVHTDFNSWKTGFALRDDINLHAGVISFLGNTQYQKFFHEEEQVDTAWGSPRSWTRFANEIFARETWYKKIITSDTCLYLGSGYVGKEGASEFTTYYKIYSEFDIDNIFANFTGFTLPEDGVKKYALAYALTVNYIGREDRSKHLPGMSFLISLYMKDSPELAIMIIKEMRQLEKSLNKKNIVNNIILQIQKIEPELARAVLKEVIELTSSM